MYRVIAFDPGVTTGWATYTAEKIYNPLAKPQGYYEYVNETWACGYLANDHHRDIIALLELQATSEFVIVCESFEYRNRARAGLRLESKEYIGIIKLFAAERGVPLLFQNAATGKGFGSDDKLERLGLLQKPVSRYPNQHINDANRHLLVYLATTAKRTDILRRLK